MWCKLGRVVSDFGEMFRLACLCWSDGHSAAFADHHALRGGFDESIQIMLVANQNGVVTACPLPDKISYLNKKLRHSGSNSSTSRMLNISNCRLKDLAQAEVLYVTERILVVTFASNDHESVYRQNISEISQMLKSKHGQNYKIFNVSKRRRDLTKLNDNKVLEFGWPDGMAPPLERLCSVCKEMELWLSANAQHVLIVHCKGGRSRAGVVIAAYMHYTNICASEDQALDRFAMKRFYDDQISTACQPSQQRYVMYFSGLLSGGIKINSNAIYLHNVALYHLLRVDSKICQPFLKIYEKMTPIFTSKLFESEEGQDRIVILCGWNSGKNKPLQLRGDVLVQCYHRPLEAQQKPQLLFRCQFNTCALQLTGDRFLLSFAKHDLDEACYDTRFPEDSRVEFVLSLTPDCIENGHSVALLNHSSPLGEVSSTDLTCTDSFENFESTIEDKDLPLDSVLDLTTSTPSSVRDSEIQRRQVLVPQQPNDSTDSGISTTSALSSSNFFYNGNNNNDNKKELKSIGSENQMQNYELVAEDRQLNDVFDNLSSHVSDNPNVGTNGPFLARNGLATKQTHLMNGDIGLNSDYSDMETSSRSGKIPPKVSPKPSTPVQQRYNTIEFAYAQPISAPHKTTSSLNKFPRPGQDQFQASETVDGFEEKDRDLVAGGLYDPQSRAFSYAPAPVLKKHFASPKKVRVTPRFQNESIADLLDSPEIAQTYHEIPQSSSIASSASASTASSRPTYFRTNSEPIASISDKFDSDKLEFPVELQPKKVAKKVNALDYDMSDIDEFLDPQFYLNYSQNETNKAAQSEPIVTHADSLKYNKGEPVYSQVVKPNSSLTRPPPSDRSSFRNTASSDTTESSLLSFINNDLRLHDDDISRPVQNSNASPDYRKLPPSTADRNAVLLSNARQPAGGSRPLVVESVLHGSPYRSAGARAIGRMHNSEWSLIDSVYRNEFGGDERLPVAGNSVARSVESTPVHYISRPTSSFSDMDADDWLERQLERLRVVKEVNDPDFQRRKHAEKLLLEELRHIHDQKQDERGRRESDYCVEGYGSKNVDPVEEEKERQQQLFDKQLNRRSRFSSDGSMATVISGKPPTPPLHERSRTPPTPRRAPSPISSGIVPTHMVTTSNVNSAVGRYTIEPQAPLTTSQRSSVNEILDPLLWQEVATDSRTAPSTNRQPPSPAPRVFAASPVFNTIQRSPKPILKKTRSDQNEMQQFTEENLVAVSSAVANGPLISGRTSADIEYSLQKPPTPSKFDNTSARADTPAFPVRRTETPLPYHPLLYAGAAKDPRSAQIEPMTRPLPTRSPSPGSLYYSHSRRSSITSAGEPMEIIHHHPVFVKDTSKYWYKPSMSREDAISVLRDKAPGTFVVRDSNSFPGAFGLALKVSQPPPGVEAKPGAVEGNELVRHFLIEPTPQGVKLKGCSNEPIFGSLSALVYQHSITPLALPCKLLLPDYDPATANEQLNTATALLEQGAACNVTYLYSCDTEALTGPEAIRRAVHNALIAANESKLRATCVHFKVSAQGITVTDNTRTLFFRRHYPVNSVTFCGLDPDDRRWRQLSDGSSLQSARIFGFVARKMASRYENAAHIFAEFEPEQPANAIVNFITKVMMTSAAVGARR